MKTDNSPFESVVEFKYSETTLMNQNSIQEEIKCRLKLENACYHCALQPFRCKPKMVEDLWTGEPSVHECTVTLMFYFITQPVNNNECHFVF